jgi:hypothetical protein
VAAEPRRTMCTWIPAQVLSVEGDIAKVNIPQYPEESKILSDGGNTAVGWKQGEVKLKNYPGKSLPLANAAKDGSLLEKEDMCDLPFLHEVCTISHSVGHSKNMMTLC